MGGKKEGTLVIIGGAEDKKGKRIILKRVVELAGGEKGRLLIITTATEYPEAVGEEYEKIFSNLGVGTVKTLGIDSRQKANDPSIAREIEEATCIFFTGGDQLRITSILGGTLANEVISRGYAKGLVITGTSAGASVMSKTMIVAGENDEPAITCTLKMGPGMGWIDEVVVDQHFSQRGRIGRLLCAVAQNPYPLGIGIDEDTAIVVKSSGIFEVIGTNSVTVVDGRSISYSNVSETNPEDPLALSNVTVHTFPAGYLFDLRKRELVVERTKGEKVFKGDADHGNP